MWVYLHYDFENKTHFELAQRFVEDRRQSGACSQRRAYEDPHVRKGQHDCIPKRRFDQGLADRTQERGARIGPEGGCSENPAGAKRLFHRHSGYEAAGQAVEEDCSTSELISAAKQVR